MKSLLRVNPMRFLCHVLFLLTFIPAYAQGPDAQRLVLNQSSEREIKGGESHFFLIQIAGSHTARVEIEQKGVDISLAAYKPTGERFIESESASGVLGSDLILVTAEEDGEYRVEVSPADPKAAAGKYIIKFAETRASTPQDFAINSAAMKITKVAEEADALRRKGTRDGRLQALEKFQEVIALSKIKQDKVWEVVAFISSGLVCEQLGEVQRSLDLYLRGLALAREIGNRQYEGTAINNLAVGYLGLGEYETSISYLTQALTLQTETGNRRGQGVVLNNMGTAYLLLRDLPKAADHYRQALEVRRDVKDQRGEGFALNNLGQVFLQGGDFLKAKDFLQQALALRRAIVDRQGEAVTLRNLGTMFYRTGDDKEALDYFGQANLLAKQLGDRRVEADTDYWLAMIEAKTDDFTKAIEHIESGLKIIEQIRGEIVNPQLRTSYFSTVPQFYELYISLLVSRSQKTKDENDIALALEMSERARARTMVELLQEARVNVNQGIDTKLLDDARELQDALNAKFRDRTLLLSGKNTPEQSGKITNEINELTTNLENLQVKIGRENPRYADLTSGATSSSKEIRDLLDDKTVLLEYELGEMRSFLWLVKKDSIKVFTLPPRNEIERVGKDFYNAMVSRDKKEIQTNALQKRLDDTLLEPVAVEIKNKRLAIVADGILQLIPFSSLSKAADNEIVVLPSASVLTELRRAAGRGKAPEKAIAIFADPVFEPTDTRLSIASRIVSGTSPQLGKVLRDFNVDGPLPRLLSSRIEGKGIANLFKPAEVAIKLDFEANKENAASDDLARYRILHFATHGLLDTANPESSGLVFSLFDKNGKPQDGFVRLNQIYNLNLASDLVVLSACQTALGKDVRGEGLIGLTRGFMYAGAQRVMASLWKVDDAATAEFMKRFYKNLLQEKRSSAAALKKTQDEMKQIPRFRFPYYWAGFTLQGDWK